MTYQTLFFAFALVAVGVLTLAALVGMPGRLRNWTRVAALAVAGATLSGAYAGGAALLGRPKPARLEILGGAGDEARLAGAHYVEGRAIYLWLLRPGEVTPRAYALPWSQEAAEALQSARGEAQANGTEVQVRGDLRNAAAADGLVFYAPPPPAMPPKHAG